MFSFLQKSSLERFNTTPPNVAPTIEGSGETTATQNRKEDSGRFNNVSVVLQKSILKSSKESNSSKKQISWKNPQPTSWGDSFTSRIKFQEPHENLSQQCVEELLERRSSAKSVADIAVCEKAAQIRSLVQNIVKEEKEELGRIELCLEAVRKEPILLTQEETFSLKQCHSLIKQTLYRAQKYETFSSVREKLLKGDQALEKHLKANKMFMSSDWTHEQLTEDWDITEQELLLPADFQAKIETIFRKLENHIPLSWATRHSTTAQKDYDDATTALYSSSSNRLPELAKKKISAWLEVARMRKEGATQYLHSLPSSKEAFNADKVTTLEVAKKEPWALEPNLHDSTVRQLANAFASASKKQDAVNSITQQLRELRSQHSSTSLVESQQEIEELEHQLDQAVIETREANSHADLLYQASLKIIG